MKERGGMKTEEQFEPKKIMIRGGPSVTWFINRDGKPEEVDLEKCCAS